MRPPARAPRIRRWAAIVVVIVAGVGLVPAAGQAVAGPAADTGCTSVPFHRGQSGYSTFRIPAIITIGDGALLAFAEGRVNGEGDTGDVDLVSRRSLDGGCSWEALLVVADHGTDTIGNPAPVYDPVTGEVILLATGNGGRVTSIKIRDGRASAATTRRAYQLTSSDGGQTWAEQDITAQVKAKRWRWYATGPGHGVQIVGGKYDGRLVMTGAHTNSPSGKDTGLEYKYGGTHSIISDDHGRTWRIGFVDNTYDGRVNTNESGVAQLARGRLYFNSRDQDGRDPGNRAYSYSSTGGSTLSERFRAAPRIAAPIVQCSVLGLGGRLYFAGPSSLDGTRSRLTIRSTDDDGVAGRFTVQTMLWAGFAAYSDLVTLTPSTIGVLYERGKSSPYEEIAFETVDTTRLRAAR